MSEERRLLIVGCGYVGGALAERCTEAGWTVWGLRRTVGSLPASVRPVAADLGAPQALAAQLDTSLPSEVDAVVYLVSAGARDELAYRRAYVDGVSNVFAAIGERGVKRLIFASSTAVYGQSDGSWVDENSPTEPTGFAGRLMLQGEQLVAQMPCRGVAVRFGGIYGPGRTRMIDRIRDGYAVASSDCASYRNRIHRDDCAGALAHLLSIDEPEPIYVGVDDEPADLREVQAWMAEKLGCSKEPLQPLEPVAGGRGGNKRCRNRRLRASGYRFRFPNYQAGYGAMLVDMGLVPTQPT